MKFKPEHYEQGQYDEMDELDDMSEAASSYVLPKTVAPMGNQERSSVADSNLFNEGTLRGSILRGRSRIAQESAEKFKDLTLDEVVNLLDNHNPDVKANAAGYLQHLAYKNDENKNDIRHCGGIPKLIDILDDRNDDPRVVENTTGALRNISYGLDQNKVSINVAEGVSALNKALRRATAKIEDKKSVQMHQWSLVQVHAAGALWNLSSHKNLKQPMLDQCLSTLITCVLVPWSRHMLNGGQDSPPSKYSDVFTAVSGILRNLSSFSPQHGVDSARDRMRQTEGLIDSLVDIVSNVKHYDQDILKSKYFENVICALRNLTFKCARDQPRLPNPQVVVKPSCCSTKKEEAPYSKPVVPNDSASATGVNRLFQPGFMEPVIHLINVSPNLVATEAAIGIVQNLTSDNYKSSIYLRAHIRDLNGIPPLVQFVECIDNNVAHSAVVALRNLAEDIQNKKTIGKYGMQAIVSKLPRSPEDMTCSTKTATSSLYLIRLLVILNKENSDLLCETDGLKKVVDINTKPGYQQKLRKAAGQVLTHAWEVQSMRKKYKNLGFSEKDFKPVVQSGAETLKKSKNTNGLSPETEKLIADSNV